MNSGTAKQRDTENWGEQTETNEEKQPKPWRFIRKASFDAKRNDNSGHGEMQEKMGSKSKKTFGMAPRVRVTS